MTGDERLGRREALALLNRLQAADEAAEAEEVHAIIEIDPQTGSIQVYGPYPDGFAAVAAIEQKRAYWATHTGEPMGLWLPVLMFPPE